MDVPVTILGEVFQSVISRAAQLHLAFRATGHLRYHGMWLLLLFIFLLGLFTADRRCSGRFLGFTVEAFTPAIFFCLFPVLNRRGVLNCLHHRAQRVRNAHRSRLGGLYSAYPLRAYIAGISSALYRKVFGILISVIDWTCMLWFSFVCAWGKGDGGGEG